MMPPTPELQRLIREAEPRFAIANAPSTREEPRPPAASTDPEGTGETAMLPAPEEIRRLIREAEPAYAIAATTASERTALTLDEYAVIRATSQLHPHEAGDAWKRYGVAPGDRAAVESALLREIAASPAATQRFNERVEHFLGYLVSARGPRE